MLVAFSDLHLSDETTSVNVHQDAFKRILKNLIVVNRDKERDRSTTRIKEIIIVLLGDIFDFVRTDYWLDENNLKPEERPWNGSLNKSTGMNEDKNLEKHYSKVLDGIFNTESSIGFFETLNTIKESSSIPVNIVYVVGNHDRVLNNFPSLKDRIAEKLDRYSYKLKGKEDEIKFVNEYRNDDYALFCRHGHEWDKDNYGYEFYKLLNNKNKHQTDMFDKCISKVQSVGEVITCELMSGIIYRLKSVVQEDFLNTIKNLNNVRPMADSFSWLYWFGSGVKSGQSKDRDTLFEVFKESLRFVLISDLAKKWDETKFIDITEGFKTLLFLINDLDFKKASGRVKFLNSVNKAISKFRVPKDMLLDGAAEDFAKINPQLDTNSKTLKTQYILYGHTHEARNDYINGYVNGSVEMYINTGTFLPYIQRTSNDSFASAHQMTIVFIYRRDEDTEGNTDNANPTLELWNGIKRKEYKVR